MGIGTEVGRVRGLGSAKTGVHHWWLQRVTAVVNVLLLTWLTVSLFRLPLTDYRAVIAWVRDPFVAVPLIIAVGNVFWHMRLGLQVVVEDYQHDESKLAGILLITFFTAGAAALAIFSILKIAFGAAA